MSQTKRQTTEDAMRLEITKEITEIIGSGYVPDYYAQMAQGFIDIAIEYAQAAAKERKRGKAE